ncbi:MAG: hypothetical protein QM817_38300 [Archangium sp.]
MRGIRSAIATGVLTLCACGTSGDPCFTPRTGAETECAVYDSPEHWQLHSNVPVKDLDRFCKASCIDVPTNVSIYGYSDLREVPLLAKIRTVDSLSISVGGMTDLRGLEQVDIVDELRLEGSSDLMSFTSLTGMTDHELRSLELKSVYGLKSLDGAQLERLARFSAEGVGLQRLDLSAFDMSDVYIRSAQINELALGTGTKLGITLETAGPLSTFTWRRPFTASFFGISHNENLSTCFINDFVAETKTQGATVLVNDNGPCP